MKKYIASLLGLKEKPLGTFLYIGAGSGSHLAAINSFSPKRIVAVEASSELYSSLNRKSKKYANISAVNSWVLPPGQKNAAAVLYNNPRYNTLASKNNIESKHTNVKAVERVTVSGEPLDSFIDGLHIDANEANVLVIDTHNVKDNLLVDANELYLKNFDFLVLAMYGEEKVKSELFETEELYLFDKILFINEEIIPFEFFIRNEKVEQLLLAKKQAHFELVKLREDLALVNKKAQVKADSNSLENSKLKVRIEELKTEITELNVLNEKARLDLVECSKELDVERKCHQESRERVESLNKQQLQIKAEIAETNGSISLIQKMYAKAQIDLESLQIKYSEKLASEKELIDLVNELREKLSIASEYYFKLQKEHPELLTSVTNEDENK